MQMKVSGTHVSKQMIILIFTSPAADKTAIEIVRFITFVERPAIWII